MNRPFGHKLLIYSSVLLFYTGNDCVEITIDMPYFSLEIGGARLELTAPAPVSEIASLRTGLCGHSDY
jgi:hypothetical protein